MASDPDDDIESLEARYESLGEEIQQNKADISKARLRDREITRIRHRTYTPSLKFVGQPNEEKQARRLLESNIAEREIIRERLGRPRSEGDDEDEGSSTSGNMPKVTYLTINGERFVIRRQDDDEVVVGMTDLDGMKAALQNDEDISNARKKTPLLEEYKTLFASDPLLHGDRCDVLLKFLYQHFFIDGWNCRGDKDEVNIVNGDDYPATPKSIGNQAEIAHFLSHAFFGPLGSDARDGYNRSAYAQHLTFYFRRMNVDPYYAGLMTVLLYTTTFDDGWWGRHNQAD